MSSGRFTVATFNIHHGRGRDGRVDIARTAAVLTGLDADLVALQEVDRNLPRSGSVDQATELERLTGFQVSFAPVIQFEGGEYGLAMATKDRIDITVLPLPSVGEAEPRAAVVMRWQDISIVSTHLSRSPVARKLQTEALAAIAVATEPPAMVVGDLNQPRSQLGPLIAAGFVVARPSLPRFQIALPTRHIDHVLTGPGLEVIGAAMVTTDASDHLPLVVTVKSAAD